MKILYRLYQLCIAAPIAALATLLTAGITIAGCFFNGHFWGYYPRECIYRSSHIKMFETIIIIPISVLS